MFEPMSGLPDGVIGFEAVGQVEATDYDDVLMPALARGAESGGVRLVLVLGDRFKGYSPGAMKEDAGLVSHAKRLEADGGRQRPRVGRPPGDGVRLDGAQASSSGSASPSGTPRSPGSPSSSERDRGRAGAPGRGPLPRPRPAIRIKGLVKHFGSIEAVRGIDLEVRTGEVFGYVGPNGAGKSTTIRCLLDLIRPTSGSIEVLGQDPRHDGVDLRAPNRLRPGRAATPRADDLTPARRRRSAGSAVAWTRARVGLDRRSPADRTRPSDT